MNSSLFQVKAPAKAGALAPLDVHVPAQATTLGPEKTSFFQALQIPTKITRGCIEILVSYTIHLTILVFIGVSFTVFMKPLLSQLVLNQI